MPYSNNARIELTRGSEKLEQMLIPITAELNRGSLKVNYATWQRNFAEAEQKAIELNELCQKETHNPDFRANSPADCAYELFDVRKLKSGPLSKRSGRASTDADTLTELANQGSRLADMILNARSAISCLSQLTGWKEYATRGIVQAKWDSLGQPQGRYISDDPCLNNRIVPIRETIEPEPGYSFLSLDLGQAEYVTWASLSKDIFLSEAFLNGVDFHTETAKAVKELVPNWQPKDGMRPAGKTINFAILYKMGSWALARKLGCSGQTAQQIIDAWYNRASGAGTYQSKVLTAAKRDGCVETYFGRRRYCSEYQAETDRRKYHELEKTLWHHVNSGTAAELLKFKQLEGWAAVREKGFGPSDVRLSLNMFDECIWSVRDEILNEVREIMEEIWNRTPAGFLKFPVTVMVGKNWGQISK